MKDVKKYDAVIIGAGQGGAPLAIALAKADWRVALVERSHVGGTCINEGCTPTKTMAASARVAYLARRAADFGVHAGSVVVDQARVRQRKQEIVEIWRQSSERRLRGTENLDLLMGEASFVDGRTIEVRLLDGGIQMLGADKVFINTGARPAMPPIPGLDGVGALDSTTVMELDETPEHLLVMGGGYIGLEFGQMFRRFGSRVTIVERAEALALREDEDVREEIAKILREDGIEILTGTEIRHARRTPDDEIELALRLAAGEGRLTGSHLLVGVGRVPNTDRLNLAAAGIETDGRGYVRVNDRLETNVPGIYALGDVKGGPAFTHISYDDFRVIRSNLLQGGNASIKDRLVSYAVFTDPQLAHVGLSEREAREQGRNTKVAKLPMDYVARALEVDEPRGFIKAIVDADSGQILGATVLGIEGGELMAILQTAMLGHLHYSVLRDAVFAHPTLAEALNNLFGTIE